MATRTKKATLERYAAKLLFQYRVSKAGVINRRRLCEERLVVVKGSCAKEALLQVKASARASEHKYKNSDGNLVAFQFVGVLEMLHLGSECEENEYWYEIRELMEPMERRKALCPPEGKLNAIYWESPNPRTRRRDSGSSVE
jgi:Domain of unknown function (DUF4288)